MLFELLGFLLSTNAKVKKMTTVSAVMFVIAEMYIFQIHLHYFLAHHNTIIQIYPVSEGYLRKIPVERRGKYPEPL
jgi:hypothetical protein